jgi:SAM-dependent methyltransferase
MAISRGGASPDWYAGAFDATTTEMPWADETLADVERVLKTMRPPPGARILDLACGVGRHALELARRGFSVVGVDISPELIEIAEGEAAIKRVEVEYVAADLRELTYEDEFDAVLGLHDGAVGYFEDDAENRRTFETIGRALRPGGAALLQIPNLLFAAAQLPEKTWTLGATTLELIERDWDPRARCVEGEVTAIHLDDVPWDLRPIAFRQRLYGVEELRDLFASVGMALSAVLDAAGEPFEPTAEDPEIFVLARKQ